MVFSRRERIILAVTVTAVCLLVLDYYVLSPVWGRLKAVRADKERLLAAFAQDGLLMKRRQQLAPRWREMLAGGLQRDPTAAASTLLRNLRSWSSETGVRLSNLQPEDRSAQKTELPEITVHVAGAGSMEEVSRLLWRIEAAKSPIKIRMLQLGTSKSGTDDLSVHLKVSTVYAPMGEPPPGPGPGGRAGEGGRQ